MATTTVADILQRVRLILQDPGPAPRWSDDELCHWLNESYQAIVLAIPAANAVHSQHPLQPGSRQRLPERALRLLDVTGNCAADSDGSAVTRIPRAQLDAVRRRWQQQPASHSIQHITYEAHDPHHFYVYPPAAPGAQLALTYARQPDGHPAYAQSQQQPLQLDDSYQPAIVDYILYRAFSKDADFAANANRAAGHYQAFNLALGRSANPQPPPSPAPQASP